MKINPTFNSSGLGQKLAIFLVAGTALITTGTAIAKISSTPRTTQAVAGEIEPRSTAPIDALITPTPIITDIEPSPTEIITPAVTATPTLAPTASPTTLTPSPTILTPTPTAKPKVTLPPEKEDEEDEEEFED